MINQKLKAKIVEKFCTQADFADFLGIDETYVSKIVRRRRQLSETDTQQWSDALKCKPEEIFEG